ncbi:MAG: AgmX/PglI C-terminal domain-containing protein [Archangium sp.]|nr:AgmX/PglI C-terminal domain-containing protein [Archangium sp.]MDP3152480.1 AgmX/PglI C-terminal domain-containing protein [Archangium sp.]MDP3572350.1 AgmX/PglI C-terminal domain-containing protein [Archangium sp.]
MGPNDQGWLFREGDLILGPVASQQIIDKLYAGELLPQSEVQLLGSGRFVKVSEIADFKVHVAKSEAKKRVDAHAHEHQSEQKKKLTRALGIGAGVLVTLGIVVAVLGSYLAVHTPNGKTAEELAWGDITIDAPSISKAKRRVDDELVDYQGSTKKPPVGNAPIANRPPVGNNPPKNPTTKPPLGNSDPDGMSMGEVDEAGINAVVARNKSSLIPCIKTVAKPGVYLKIPIEFSIAEAGKVSKVWVDNPDLKDSGLQECLLKELQKWPFKSGHSGNSVNLSFNVGKKG